MVDVSVIIASYNPNPVKLFATLESVVEQNKINLEIVVVDDGSKCDYFNEIKEWFMLKEFNSYKLIKHKINVGTCKNIFDGVIESSGKYIKTISPGDFLYDKNILCNWYEYMEKSQSLISFGNAVYYHMEDNVVAVDRVICGPQNRMCFKKKQNNQIKICFLLLCDVPIGAAYMFNSSIIKKYLELIKEDVVYAEDFAMKLMVLDNISIDFYDAKVVWYEFGTGISTSKDKVWNDRLNKDLLNVNKIINNNFIDGDKFAKKYIAYNKRNSKKFNKLIKYIYFPSAIRLNLKKNKADNYSEANLNENELDSIRMFINKGELACK